MSLDFRSHTRDLAAYSVTRTPTPILDDRINLPSLSHRLNISRPPSVSSQCSNYNRPSPKPNLQLPTFRQFSALASISSSRISESSLHSSLPAPMAMNFQGTPAATVGPGGQIPVCGNCGTTYTPLWRRDESGSVLCNACGLFLKLHGRSRPISLKTDVIKSRNRARPQQTRKRPLPTDNNEHSNQLSPLQQHSEAAILAADAARRVSAAAQDPTIVNTRQQYEASPSPLSQLAASTPNHNSLVHPNIAPQVMFDNVSLDHPSFYVSPSLTNPFRPLSPATFSALSSGQFHGGDMSSDTTPIQIRVSELEIINGLLKGRVQNLELQLEEMTRLEQNAQDEKKRMQADFDDLKRKVFLLECENEELKDDRPSKKMRLSDEMKDDGGLSILANDD